MTLSFGKPANISNRTAFGTVPRSPKDKMMLLQEVALDHVVCRMCRQIFTVTYFTKPDVISRVLDKNISQKISKRYSSILLPWHYPDVQFPFCFASLSLEKRNRTKRNQFSDPIFGMYVERNLKDLLRKV